MHRHYSIRILFFLGALLLFQPLTASAKYLIEFADGQRMTVSNYEAGRRHSEGSYLAWIICLSQGRCGPHHRS